MASYDPRARRYERQVLEDRRREDACVTIARRHETRRHSDKRSGLDVDEPVTSEGGYFPFKVWCPSFFCELWQVCWPSASVFKQKIPVKYDGRLNPAEFLSIYTIVVQAAGGRDEKVFANYFPLALKPNVRSWLMHPPENSISSWVDLCNGFVGAFTGGHQEPGWPGDLQILPQKEGRVCRSTCRGLARCIGTFQDERLVTKYYERAIHLGG